MSGSHGWRGIAPLRASGAVPTLPDEYERWRDAQTWDPARDGRFAIENDLTPAEWIEPLLGRESGDVPTTVPRGYEAYARIFFPFVGAGRTELDGKVQVELVSWSERAARNGRVAGALMEIETISTEEGADRELGATDSLSIEHEARLVPILARHTTSSNAWFLLWDGWGDLNERAFALAPKVHHEGQDLYLLSGQLGAYQESRHVPYYFWPEDRAWCLCSHCDFYWCYLAGSAACVEDVLAVPVLDAFALRPDNT